MLLRVVPYRRPHQRHSGPPGSSTARPRASLNGIFHVGLLKKFVGTPPDDPPPLPVNHHGAAVPEPERAVRTRLDRGVLQVLIHYKGEPTASVTWEDTDTFIECYPLFQLKDELLVEGAEMSCGATTTLEGSTLGTRAEAKMTRLWHPRAWSTREMHQQNRQGRSRPNI